MTDGIVTNCTFSKNQYKGNYGVEGAGAIEMSVGTLINCIFWGDSANVGPTEITPNATSIKNCVIQGGYSGSGAVDSIFTFDPLLGTLGNYGGLVATIPIETNSPARDKGTTAVPAGVDISKDARGSSRDSKPDIGAYEVQ
jgi:hypothetical protein